LGLQKVLLLFSLFPLNLFAQHTSLTRSQWSYLRCVIGSKIGRPRRFSPAFLSSEREKLQRYRQSARSIQFGYNSTLLLHEFPYQVPSALSPTCSTTLTTLQVYDPVDVGDCVTVYHIPTASLQRGQVLSLHSFSPSSAEYLIQFDSLALGHGVVSDDLIAIHGEVPVRYQRRRISEPEGGGAVGDENEEDTQRRADDPVRPLSLDTFNLSPRSHLKFSPSLLSSLEDLWRKCLKESSQKIQRMLSSTSLPPPPNLYHHTSSSSSTYTSPLVPNSPSSLLLSSTDQSSLLGTYHVPSPEDTSLEELLLPLLASLLFIKHADAISVSLSPNSSPSNRFHSSSPSSSSSSTLLRDIHSFLLDKIQEVYAVPDSDSLTPAMSSLSQLYDSLLQLFFKEETTGPTPAPGRTSQAPISSLFLPPSAYRPSSSLLSTVQQSIASSKIAWPQSGSGSGPGALPNTSSAPLRSNSLGSSREN
jgi:hypothetical protein